MAQGIQKHASLRDLTDPRVLQARLEEGLRLSRDEVMVGLSVAGAEAFASVNYGVPPEACAGDLSVEPGCTTKLLTAALAMQTLQNDGLTIEDGVDALLPGARSRSFAGITVRHLLQHTHGLDDSALAAVPRVDGRRIDAHALMSELASAPRLFAPGERYSYSNAGSWLMGAYLEERLGRPYDRILSEALLMPLRGVGSATEQPICPALGTGVRTTLRSLLAFTAECGREKSSSGIPTVPIDEVFVRPHDVWTAMETGIGHVWKSYGEGWYGHHSVLPGSHLMLRCHPQSQVAIAIACGSRMPSSVASILFGGVLPPIANPHRRDGASPSDPSRLRRCTGVYGRRGSVVSVEQGSPNLRIHAYARRGAEVETKSYCSTDLHTMSEAMFYSNPFRHWDFQFVQFVGEPDGPVTHLWNGRTLWRRLAG